MQDWVDAYKELCAVINDPEKGISEIVHTDLWHEQVDYLPNEYPWGDRALFMNFNVLEDQTIGMGIQDQITEISFILAFVTVGDTHHGSDTQDDALEFGLLNRKIHKLMQGRYGANFSNLDRVRGPRRIPAPMYLLCYEQVYRCVIRDMSAMPEPGEKTLKKMTPGKITTQPNLPDLALYKIDE